MSVSLRAPGVYFVRLTTPSRLETRKLVVGE